MGVAIYPFPRGPITLSDDEQGVYNHIRNARYLGSMKPFSVSVRQDPYKVGPLLVINGVITPISRVITTVTHL